MEAVMTSIIGADISRYQDITDWKALSKAISFVAIRCTVGDYYSDYKFEEYWDKSGEVGIPHTAYMVIAPADSTNVRKISAKAQMDYFFSKFGDREPDYPIILDAELSRTQTREYITTTIAECIAISELRFDEYPLMYTRKTWLDFWTNPHPSFGKCGLFAARYATGITGPWSDGVYRFRDWKDWVFWQKSDAGRFPGIANAVDVDVFNGGTDDLSSYLGKKTITQRLAILEREAALHGWNLEP
jgi:GH25 family lysozyme M1 (1,4-beta-N-acetylmuramidase)